MHEGPARISKLGTVALSRGMILSNEPGYYKTAAYGIRIENLLLVIAAPEPAGAEKPLNAFETLTLAPIDRRLIDMRMLTAKERNWVDSYHARVQEVLGPLLDAPTRAWLDAATQAAWKRLMDAPTSASQPQSKQVTPWRLLALLMAMTAIGPATLNILVPALPGLVTRLASDTGTVQLTLSLYLLSLAAAQLLLGPLSDRFGRRPVVLAGLALSVVASLAAIAASSIGALIVRARRAGGRRLDRHRDRPRHHPRSLRARPRRRHDRPGHHRHGDRADDLAADRRHSRHRLRLGGDLPVHRRVQRRRAAMGNVRAAGNAAGKRGAGARHADRAMARADRQRQIHGYVLCGALGSAPFFTFLGGGPHVVVTLMGRTSAEYGVWFAMTSLGYMSGNFTASRLSQRFGVDAMIMAGIAFELTGASLTALLVATMPEAAPRSFSCRSW